MPETYQLPRTPPEPYLGIARNCSCLDNVASQMAQDWVDDKKPGQEDFKWKPRDPCPYTKELFAQFDTKNVSLIWSTFIYGVEKKTITEPFGFIVTDGISLYLVFRGTLFDQGSKSPDFIADLDANLIPYKDQRGDVQGKVSEGFWRVFCGLEESLKKELRTVSESELPLVITGHSLGSTLATFAHALVADPSSEFELASSAFPQASPKVGNRDFVSFYNGLPGATYRLVNAADSVPKTPPFDAYEHVGSEVVFDADYLDPKAGAALSRASGTTTLVTVWNSDEQRIHNPCCSYAYALSVVGVDPYNPVNPANAGGTCAFPVKRKKGGP